VPDDEAHKISEDISRCLSKYDLTNINRTIQQIINKDVIYTLKKCIVDGGDDDKLEHLLYFSGLKCIENQNTPYVTCNN